MQQLDLLRHKTAAIDQEKMDFCQRHVNPRKSCEFTGIISHHLTQHLSTCGDKHSKEMGMGIMNDIDLPAIAQELLTRHSDQFNGLFGAKTKARAVIRRIFTRSDMRDVVNSCLIPEYRIPRIIEAVTDYLFDLANLDRHHESN
jgi:hypothetical protein